MVRRSGGSWAPALLAGHGVLAGVLVLVAVLTASTGARTDATPWDADSTRAVVLGLGLVVVVGTLVRVGRRSPGPGARWWAVVALWLLVPWIWTGMWLGGSSPAALAVGIPLLAFYFWPFLLGALLVGVVVATSLVPSDG